MLLIQCARLPAAKLSARSALEYLGFFGLWFLCSFGLRISGSTVRLVFDLLGCTVVECQEEAYLIVSQLDPQCNPPTRLIGDAREGGSVPHVGLPAKFAGLWRARVARCGPGPEGRASALGGGGRVVGDRSSTQGVGKVGLGGWLGE